MAASPGDTVYQYGNLRIDTETNQCTVEVRVGVLKKDGNSDLRPKSVRVALDPALITSIMDAVKVAIDNEPPEFIVGATAL
jgi:hypothetical protein